MNRAKFGTVIWHRPIQIISFLYTTLKVVKYFGPSIVFEVHCLVRNGPSIVFTLYIWTEKLGLQVAVGRSQEACIPNLFVTFSLFVQIL